MYAVIETGGKQLKVEAGQSIFVEKLNVEAGEEVVFDKVCLLSNEGTKIGTPYVEGEEGFYPCPSGSSSAVYKAYSCIN